MSLTIDNAGRSFFPPARTYESTTQHRASDGETARSVSAQYRVNTEDLLAINPQIREPDLPLLDGEVLEIPQSVQEEGPQDAPTGTAQSGFEATSELGDPQARATQQAAEIRQQTLDEIGVPVEQWTSAEAARYTGAIADAAEADPAIADALIATSTVELQRSAELLGNATENKDDAIEDVKALTENVSRLGNVASPEIAAALAYGIAEEIPNDSEQNWVDDGFGEYADASGNDRFRNLVGAALDAQGKGEARDEMLHRSAGNLLGEGGLLDDIGGVVSSTFDAITEFPGDVWNFARDRVLNPVGDRLREAISDVLDIEGRLARLESPGDSIVLTADVEGTLLGVEVGVGATIRVEKTENGYALELTGEGSLGVAAEMGLPGLPSANAEATGTISATVRFEFGSLEEATRAAEIVAATGVGVGLSGTPAAPVGGILVASQIDDFGFLAGNYAQTTLQFESEASISADLAEELGLPGAEFSGTISNAVAIELPRDGTPRLILEQALSVDGELDLAGPFTLPDGSTVLPSNVSGSGEVSLRTSVPIDISPDALIDDPIGELQSAGRSAIDGAETTLAGTFSFDQGVSIGGAGASVDDRDGVQVDLSATVPTSELGPAISQAFSGDLYGAIDALSQNATISGSLRTYSETSVGIGAVDEQTDGDSNTDPNGETVGVAGVASVEVTAGYSERTSDVVFEFEGSPDDWLGQFGGFLENVVYVAS